MSKVTGQIRKERIADTGRPWTEVVEIRGPGNSAFLIEMHQSKDVYEVRFLLKNFILRKHRCRYEKSGIPEFQKRGYIITKQVPHYREISRMAPFHSSEVGADSVIPMKESKQLQFLCKPNQLFITAKKLANFGYEIDTTGVTYFPLNMVYLDRKNRIICENLLRVLKSLPNVVTVYDNIFR